MNLRCADVVVLGLMVVGGARVAAAQSTEGVSEQKGAPAASVPTAPKGTAQKFPYPGETPAPDAPGEVKRPAGYENETPYVPDAPAGGAAGQSNAGKKLPPAYPGDPDAPKADAAQDSGTKGGKVPPPYPGDPEAGAATPSGSDGFSSSNSSSGADAGPLSDVGSSGDEPEPDARKHPVRKKLPKIDPQTPESREAEDVSVAEFYQKSGNYPGAYARAKDAVATLPDEPFGHLALAEAARKLGKADEAKTEYAKVLTLDPAPKERKTAEKALADLLQAKR